VGGGPDGVEIVFADMTHDAAQWRSAQTHLGEARAIAAAEVDDHPTFGVYADIVRETWVGSARALRDVLRDGASATGGVADLIDANTHETTTRDGNADGRVTSAGGGGGGGAPGGGSPGGGGPGGSGATPTFQVAPVPGTDDRTPLWLVDDDGDGRPDVLEDEDHDGVLDAWETGRDGTPRIWRDRDHDGRPDLFADLDGDGVADLLQDTDRDGTADLLEDRDGDGLYDVWEDVKGAPSSVADADADGVPDLWEDTDGDGVVDLAEDEDLDGVPDLLQQGGSGEAVPSAEPVPTDVVLPGSGEGLPTDEDWQPGTRRSQHGRDWA
jgi:hypothetical protein